MVQEALNVSKIIDRLVDKEDSVFDIYLHGASRHASKKNVDQLRKIQDDFKDDRDRHGQRAGLLCSATPAYRGVG